MTEESPGYHHVEHRKKRRREPRRPHPRNYISLWVKYILFGFNLLFWLAALFLVGMGVYTQVEKNKSINDALQVLFDPSILIMIPGVIIFMMSFCGCIGALRDNIILLRIYEGALCFLLLLELLLGLFLVLMYFLPELRTTMGFLVPADDLKQAIRRYEDEDNDNMRALIDSVQQALGCCGIDDERGYKDWSENIYYNCSSQPPSFFSCWVPSSCCRRRADQLLNEMCGKNVQNYEPERIKDVIYTQGCIKAFYMWLQNNQILVGGICAAIMLFQIIALCFAHNYAWQIKQQKSQWD